MACAVGVLGPLRVVIDGVDVTPRAPKERSLLALLAVRHGRVVSMDNLIDELWPDLAVERARRVLWVRVADLRARLARAGAASLLELVAPGYRLAVGPDDVDAARFAALAAVGRAQLDEGRPDHAAATLGRALDLWRGDPLADAQGCVALEAEADRLAAARLDALEDRFEAELASGHHARALGELTGLARAHPLRERLGRQHVLALHLSGRPAEAVAACRQLRHRLADELGAPPSTDLARLEDALLAGDERTLARFRPARPQPFVAGPDLAATVDDRAVEDERPRRHERPVPLTTFVGRGDELAALDRLLASSRLVTLTGVGGVGKTRLALEAATLAAPRHPDGTRFVELAPVRDPAAVAPAVIEALGIFVDGRWPPDELPHVVAEHVGGRQLLLVLDNAEQVLAGVAALVHQLLSRCARLSILVTSRQVLGVPGEVAVPVPPLSLAPRAGDGASDPTACDAVDLFRDRARLARPGSALTPTEVSAAARICHRLDGLPLAIELAAARARMLAVEQIADRLDDHVSLLASEPTAGVPDRHRTMRAALDWSHELLDPPAQVALRRLAVFPGSFDLDAAIAAIEGGAAVTAPVDDGLTLLSRLVDRSLVEVVAGGGTVRYRLLQPIRRYAEEKLAAAGEADAARCRHRDLFLGRCGVLWPLVTGRDRQRAYDDRADLRAALEWSWARGDDAAALALAAIQAVLWMWPADAHGQAWLERVLARPEPAVHPARVRALGSLALALHDAGSPDRDRVDELLQQAAELAELVGDPAETAAARLLQVEVSVARGRIAEAQALTDTALRSYEELGAVAGEGWCHHALGWIAVAGGDLDAARRHFERGLAAARAEGGEWLLPHALAGVAPVLAELGDRSRALRLADEAVAAARPFTVPAVLAMALTRAGETAVLAGDQQRSVAVVAELLALLLELGTRRWAADALELAAVVLERRGDPSGAATALASAAALRTASGERGGGVRTLADEVARSARRLDGALDPGDPSASTTAAEVLEPEPAMAAVLHALRAPTPPPTSPSTPIATSTPGPAPPRPTAGSEPAATAADADADAACADDGRAADGPARPP